MSDGASLDTFSTRHGSAAVFVGTLAATVLTIIALLFVDLMLARVDRNESALRAAGLYQQGRALLDSGHAGDAADRFASAVAMERGNLRYALALAQATLADGRGEEAESILKSVLDRAETDGAVNLSMAQVLVSEGKGVDAKAYYHRAIYGRWGADSLEQRMRSRLELIAFLSQRRETNEMLSELLPLEAEAGDSIPLRKRVATLFLEAGSPRRAITNFREVLRLDPRDPDAYVGMGEAALALGNFATARADFLEASRYGANDARIEHRLALVDTLLTLAPSVRGIGDSARFERSRAVLARTLDDRERCGVLSPSTVPLADAARAMISNSTRPSDLGVAGDEMMDRANALWSARPPRCRTGYVRDEALAILLTSAGQ